MATHPFQAEVTQVLGLVINSLYSDKEVFLRELISNAADALDRARFQALTDPAVGDTADLAITLRADAAAGTLEIADDGVGMSADDLVKNLGTVAHSGSRAFLEGLARLDAEQRKGAAPSLIGQFGVGFYSAFLVADRVEVVSRAAGATEAHRWASDGKTEFTLEPAERATRGTTVLLHLRADQRGLLEGWRLKQLVRRWSDFVGYPIRLWEPAPPAKGPEADPASEEAEPTMESGEGTFQTINQASALWQRPAREVTEEQYTELYKHLTHDWEPPLAHQHFHIEGTQQFAGIVYIPRRAPGDLFDPDPKHGVRLHVRRVLILESCEELVPRWLRFVKGVVDSEDLPLNVSRELLQDSRAVKVLRQQVIHQTLEALNRLASERPDDYRAFWSNFGAVLKEGLHFEPERADKLTPLLRFASTAGADGGPAGAGSLCSLAEYVARMPEGQDAIYYAVGTSLGALRQSPHLEAVRGRGFEVLLLTDPVDPFAIEHLPEFQARPAGEGGRSRTFKLVDVASAGLALPTDDAATREARATELAPLLARMQAVLGDRVGGVVPSARLTDSPACLVIPEGGLQPHVERLLRERKLDLPRSARVLEVNLEHPLVAKLAALPSSEAMAPSGVEASSPLLGGAPSDEFRDWVELLHDQALLAEGSPVEDPAALARKIARLMARG